MKSKFQTVADIHTVQFYFSSEPACLRFDWRPKTVLRYRVLTSENNHQTIRLKVIDSDKQVSKVSKFWPWRRTGNPDKIISLSGNIWIQVSVLNLRFAVWSPFYIFQLSLIILDNTDLRRFFSINIIKVIEDVLNSYYHWHTHLSVSNVNL